MTDPYRTLGVSRSASQDEIRKAFKKLARKFHPDVNKDPGAEDRFKAINNAYAAVGDPEKRKLWDEFGEASTKPGFDAERARQMRNFGGGMGGGMPGGMHFDFGGGDAEDLLSSLFGGGGRRGPRRGRDQRATLAIDFMDAVLGGEKEISVPRPGAPSDNLKVRIPAGVKDGGRLKLKGQGLPPPGGGPCGDLHLELSVRPHPFFRRRGDNDLELDLPITVLEAMRGASVSVPTPTGDVKVTIPAGARPGQLLRLKGRGVQKRAGAGHLYLVLAPTPPTSEDPEVLAAAERLETAYTEDVRAALTR
jgi:curved DNA-binding protein